MYVPPCTARFSSLMYVYINVQEYMHARKHQTGRIWLKCFFRMKLTQMFISRSIWRRGLLPTLVRYVPFIAAVSVTHILVTIYINACNIDHNKELEDTLQHWLQPLTPHIINTHVYVQMRAHIDVLIHTHTHMPT